MEAFFRSARRPSRPSEWTLEDAARFAALKEGYLLQFLSENKKAFATARRLARLAGYVTIFVTSRNKFVTNWWATF